jgi:hypothetical protein
MENLYATRKSTADEETAMRRSIPSPLGHCVTGYDASFHPVIETMSEIHAVNQTSVCYLRLKTMRGKYSYRAIVRKPNGTAVQS